MKRTCKILKGNTVLAEFDPPKGLTPSPFAIPTPVRAALGTALFGHEGHYMGYGKEELVPGDKPRTWVSRYNLTITEMVQTAPNTYAPSDRPAEHLTFECTEDFND